jgi:hypothetical protein
MIALRYAAIDSSESKYSETSKFVNFIPIFTPQVLNYNVSNWKQAAPFIVVFSFSNWFLGKNLWKVGGGGCE